MATVQSKPRQNPVHPLEHLRSAEYLTDVGVIQEYQKVVHQPKNYDVREQRREAIRKSLKGFCYSLLWAGLGLGLAAAIVRYLYLTGTLGL
ncbi:MAG: hypothetical protein HUJ26_17865 [Planctomycetaceae bacterium]|nr:hypothetical protein [Planctomycetaceae bacterium]